MISFISWVTSTYIIEAIAITNYFYRSDHRGLLYRKSDASESTTNITLNSKHKLSNTALHNTSVAPIVEKDFIETKKFSETEESKDNYYISKRFEVANIGYRNMPFGFYIMLSLDICLYLYIGLTSNTVIASTSLSNIFSIMIYGNTTALAKEYYQLIACIFILIVLFLSLGNIASLRKFTIIIMVCRFAVIFLILGCCIYSIINNGASSFSDIPKFRVENITIMLGNSIFFFMIHHSIPGIVDSFKPQRKLMSLLFVGFLISLIVMITYGFISLIAFSKFTNCDNNNFPCAIQVKHLLIQNSFALNFLSVPYVGYIINFYPLFNLITSAMQMITLKNNIIQIFESFDSKLISMEKDEVSI